MVNEEALPVEMTLRRLEGTAKKIQEKETEAGLEWCLTILQGCGKREAGARVQHEGGVTSTSGRTIGTIIGIGISIGVEARTEIGTETLAEIGTENGIDETEEIPTDIAIVTATGGGIEHAKISRARANDILLSSREPYWFHSPLLLN